MDLGHKETDRLLQELERKISREYARAYKDISKKANDYFDKFAAQDEKMLEKLKNKEITKWDYQQWRTNKMLVGSRWTNLKETLAKDLTNADQIAMSYVNGYTAEVYALNMNYATYDIEHDSRIDTSFTLYDKQTVQRLIKDDPDLLPQPKVDIPKDLRWNRQHIQSAITQGILQGESISKMAKRLQKVTDMDKRAAIRNARTAVTSSQNAGRLDSYNRASDMGIALKKVWMATLDDRTRESHVDLDGEVRELDKPFSNGLMYPADPSGAPAEVYNCRCTMVKQYDKYKTDWQNLQNRNSDKLGNMTYSQWKRERGKKNG